MHEGTCIRVHVGMFQLTASQSANLPKLVGICDYQSPFKLFINRLFPRNSVAQKMSEARFTAAHRLLFLSTQTSEIRLQVTETTGPLHVSPGSPNELQHQKRVRDLPACANAKSRQPASVSPLGFMTNDGALAFLNLGLPFVFF